MNPRQLLAVIAALACLLLATTISVADDSSGMALQARPVFSQQTQEAVDALVETFRGHQPKRAPRL